MSANWSPLSRIGLDFLISLVVITPLVFVDFTDKEHTLLVANQSHLSGCFWLFNPRFWEVAGTHEWYLSFYECRFSVGVTMRLQDTHTLPCAKEFKLFALIGSWDTKSCKHSSHFSYHHSHPSHLVTLSLIICKYQKGPLIQHGIPMNPGQLFAQSKIRGFRLQG